MKNTTLALIPLLIAMGVALSAAECSPNLAGQFPSYSGVWVLDESTANAPTFVEAETPNALGQPLPEIEGEFKLPKKIKITHRMQFVGIAWVHRLLMQGLPQNPGEAPGYLAADLNSLNQTAQADPDPLGQTSLPGWVYAAIPDYQNDGLACILYGYDYIASILPSALVPTPTLLPSIYTAHPDKPNSTGVTVDGQPSGQGTLELTDPTKAWINYDKVLDWTNASDAIGGMSFTMTIGKYPVISQAGCFQDQEGRPNVATNVGYVKFTYKLSRPKDGDGYALTDNDGNDLWDTDLRSAPVSDAQSGTGGLLMNQVVKFSE